jgi:hypothetical protein
LRSLSALAGVAAVLTENGCGIIDCRRERIWANVETNSLAFAIAQLGSRYSQMILDFADGTRCLFEPSQRWRWWRRPATKLP